MQAREAAQLAAIEGTDFHIRTPFGDNTPLFPPPRSMSEASSQITV